MAKKKKAANKSVALTADLEIESNHPRQQPSPEERYANELALIGLVDSADKPGGWKLSPARVVDFICGSRGESIRAPASAKLPPGCPKSLVIEPKFVGNRSLIERCVVTLAGGRGLLLVGQPGTAKSMIGELLATAISGTSELTIQGTAGASEDHLRYGWNYAMLLSSGPKPSALVPSPVLTAMKTGRLVRIEEITRCLPEVQDALISILSERRMMIPELSGDEGSVFSAPGFNVIATANLRDRGVSEMSSALKRRFNFETVHPIADHRQEVELVRNRSTLTLVESGIKATVDDRLLELLITTFRDLRNGQTSEGWTVEKPDAVMSTAEAVTVASSISCQDSFFAGDKDPVSLIPGYLLGVVLKDNSEDRDRLLAYWDGVVQRRGEAGDPLWKRLYDLRGVLEEASLDD